MRGRITRALLAAGAAGATITSLSLAAMGTASAAQGADVVNVSSSGWAAGDILAPSIIDTSSTWNFRYASGTTTVPDLANPVLDYGTNPGLEVFSAQLSNTKVTFAAQLFWDGSAWTQQFAEYFRNGTTLPVGDTPGTCTHTWLPGDQARMDVYYSQGSGTITYTAYDGPDAVCTATVPAWSSPDSTGGGSFREAYTGGIFTPRLALGSPLTAARNSRAMGSNPKSSDPPPIGGGNPYTNGLTSFPPWARPVVTLGTDTKLFAVTGVRVTSYNGTRGTVSGPWTYRQLIFGTSASSLSNVYVSSPVLWDGGSNFGVWVRV